MAKEGWLFQSCTCLCLYTFQKSKSANIVYQIDFQEKIDNKKAEYLQSFQDRGWTFIQETPIPVVDGSWFYFSKEIKNEESVAELYPDSVAKIQLLKKIQKRWGALAFILLSIFLTIGLPTILNIAVPVYLKLFSGTVWTLVGLIYIRLLYHTNKKIRSLEEAEGI